MIINMVNKLVDEKMEENTDMAKKNRFTQVEIVKDDMTQGEDDSQMIKNLEKAKEETASTLDTGVWEEEKVNNNQQEIESETIKPLFPSMSEIVKANESNEDNQIPKNEFNENFNEIQKQKDIQKTKKEVRKRLSQMNNSDSYTFENVVEIYRNGELAKYQCVVSSDVLANLLDRNIIQYNGELNRGWKKNSKNELVAVRSVSHINQIYDRLTKDQMHGGFIVLNLNPDKENSIEYDEDSHTITAPITTKLEILDGQHRLAAFSKILKAYRKNPESVPNPTEYQISVVIEMLDDSSAKSLFSEYCLKGLRINKSRGEYLNVEDNTNKLCREIIKFSDMKDKVEVISTSIKSNSNSIITFGVLSKNIKDNYSPQTKSEIEEMSKYLITFVDSLIQTFPKFMASRDLEERKLLRLNSLTMEALAWGGYFYISKLLQEKNKEEILNILSKFNDDIEYKGFRGKFLAKENPIFRKIMREGNKMISTSKSATWINKVFKEYVIDGKNLEEIGRE